MTPAQVIDLIRHALWTACYLSLPVLALGFATGIVISLIQVVTSIQDASFSAVPRLLIFLGLLMLFLPWMLSRMLNYTTSMLGDFTRYAQ
ncbi:MAG: flagellar biosynthetic protein FliQ [Acidobacteria bacterium]|nr:flagellar biosynthetic protein FliQ [Acidobacteriota bacterium]